MGNIGKSVSKKIKWEGDYFSSVVMFTLLKLLSKCRTATLCPPKQYVFGFIYFWSEIMTTSCIRMVGNHYSPMCFLHFVWSSTFPVKPCNVRAIVSSSKKYRLYKEIMCFPLIIDESKIWAHMIVYKPILAAYLTPRIWAASLFVIVGWKPPS